MNLRLCFSSGFLVVALLGAQFCHADEDEPKKKTSQELADEFIETHALPRDPLDALQELEGQEIDPVNEAGLDININEASVYADDSRAIDRILGRIEEQNAITELQGQKKLVSDIKLQNTLLTHIGDNVGVYRRDLVESSLLFAGLIADMKLYRFLTKRRVDHIVSKMLSDSQELVVIIKRVNESHARFEERSDVMNSVSKVFVKKEKALDDLLNPLRRYLDENHSLSAGYIPFSRRTLLPLLARWGWEKLSQKIKDTYVKRHDFFTLGNTQLAFTNSKHFMALNSAYYSAFEEDKDGKLIQKKSCFTSLKESPIALSTVLKGLMYLSNPVQGIQRVLFDSEENPWLGRWKTLTQWLGIQLPDFLFSDTMRLGLEFYGMGLSVNFYDKMNAHRWSEYVIKNRELLLKKIQTYRRIVKRTSSSEQEIKAAKDDIRSFVENGHESTSWIPGSALTTWWNARGRGKNFMSRWLALGAVAVVASKLGYMWHAMKQ